MSSARALLRLDEERAVEAIAVYLRRLCDRRSACGVLIGLSGGIDSAVLSALAVHALGKDAVHLACLYDRDSERRLDHGARPVADWLGIELRLRDIGPVMRAWGVYTPSIMRIAPLSGFVNRSIFRCYRLIVGETPFLSSLRAGSREASDRRNWQLVLETVSRYAAIGFNARHVYRRQVLEAEAASSNWLLLGAANRSEWMVGWFVEGGVDDLPLQPLKGLYKTQVRQLAVFLGVPEAIQTQAPSPDMMRGITDEFALGIPYSKIDVVLDHLEGGVSGEALAAMSVSRGELELVREMRRLSSWKRRCMHAPPVDGGWAGGFRKQSGGPALTRLSQHTA